MSWKNLHVNWGSARLGELELPAAQIVGDLARHDAAFETVVGQRRASGDSARHRLSEKVALVRVRRDQSTLSDAERQAFKHAVQALIDEGIYDSLVRLRGNLAHNMLGSLGVKGLHRFLPWHRRYLWAFENELVRVDCRLRPNELPLALPYWNWTDPFPGWLTDFLPACEPAAGTAGGPAADDDNWTSSFLVGGSLCFDQTATCRTLAGPALKPTHDDVRLILHGFTEQLPGAKVNHFVKFTYGLEGWGRRPDGSRLPAHNQVHTSVGGVMNHIHTAPTDPIFWLHMAQVDRLWSLWQSQYPIFGPALVGANQVLDPWPETADEVHSPLALGYAYDI